MPTQQYTTTIAHDSHPLEVIIQSFPRDFLRAQGLLTPLHVARQLGRERVTRPSWRSLHAENTLAQEDLTAVVYLLIAAPEFLTDPSYLLSLPQTPVAFGLSDFAADDDDLVSFARYVVQSPIVSTEESWPTPKALVELAGAGGGLGLGVLVAMGALSPLALLTVPAGIIAVGAAWAARGRVEHFIAKPADRIRELKVFLDEGLIPPEEYAKRVAEILDRDTMPRPAMP